MDAGWIIFWYVLGSSLYLLGFFLTGLISYMLDRRQTRRDGYMEDDYVNIGPFVFGMLWPVFVPSMLLLGVVWLLVTVCDKAWKAAADKLNV